MNDLKTDEVSLEWVRQALAEGSVTKEEAARLLADSVRHSLAILSEGASTSGWARGKGGASRSAGWSLRTLSNWYKPDGDLGVFIPKSSTESPLVGVESTVPDEGSAVAAGLLQPFVHQVKGLRVLELNCEGGARTRFLAKSGALVTAVTNKPGDALATGALCSGLSNVQVVLDSPQALPFHGVFDLVVIAGYHETFAAETAALNPLSQLLCRAYSALAPGGRVLLAGHNALALRHFNDQRDAYGREGAVALEGRFAGGAPRLWSTAAMARALVKADFQLQAPCALMGTVAQPRLLVSSLGYTLPAERWNLETLVRRALDEGDPGRLARFSASRVLSEAVQSDTLADWSDGYVFLAHKSTEPRVRRDSWLASVFSTAAASGTDSETRFTFDAEHDDLLVETYALGDTAPKAVLPYVNGVVYRDQLDDVVQMPGWTFEQVLQWTAVWLRCLLGSLSAEDTLLPKGTRAESYVGDYDLWVPDSLFLATPARWIQRPDGSFQCLRESNGSQETVPLAMVLYAGLTSTFATLRSVAEPADSAWLDPAALARAVVSGLGHDLLEDDLEALAPHWQHVTNAPMPAPARFVTRERPRGLMDEAKLYWATDSEGFSEGKTSTAPLALDGNAQVLRLSIATSGQPVTALRFDVANRPGCFEIERMSILQANGEVLWQWNHTREALSGLLGAALVVDQEAGCSCVLSRGNDPQFMLNVPEPALAAGGVLEVRLSAWPQRL